MNINKPLNSKKQKINIIFYITLFIIILLSIYGLTILEIDEDIYSLLPDNKQIKEEKENIKKQSEYFPDNHFIFAAIEGDVFSLDKIKHLYNFYKDLEASKSVESIFSPFNPCFIGLCI